MDTGSF